MHAFAESYSKREIVEITMLVFKEREMLLAVSFSAACVFASATGRAINPNPNQIVPVRERGSGISQEEHSSRPYFCHRNPNCARDSIRSPAAAARCVAYKSYLAAMSLPSVMLKNETRLQTT